MRRGASAIASSRVEPLTSHTPAITTKATENAAMLPGVSLRELAQRATSLGTRSAASAARRLGASSSAVIGILPAGAPFSQRTEAPVIRCGNHANSGRLRIFDNADLSVDAVLASACLPALQRATMIDGEPWWDGGYSANPALFPLVRQGAPDLLIVMLSPLVYAEVPTGADEIRSRALEFTFNAGFLREATLLSESCAAARASMWPFGRLERRLVQLRTHLIDSEEALSGLTRESRLIAHLPFLEVTCCTPSCGMCRRPMKPRRQMILAQCHRPDARDWLPVHEAAHTTFPPSDDIIATAQYPAHGA